MSTRRHVTVVGLAVLGIVGLVAGCGDAESPDPVDARPTAAGTVASSGSDKAGADADESLDPNDVCTKIPYSVVDIVGTKPATSLQGNEVSGAYRGVKCAYLSADSTMLAEVTYRPNSGADALAARQEQVKQLNYAVEPVQQLGPGAFTYTGAQGRRFVAGLDEGRKFIDVNVWNTTPAKAFEFWRAVADRL